MDQTYGLEIEASEYHPLRSLLTSPQRTASGNIVLRAGREISETNWERTVHYLNPNVRTRFVFDYAKTREVMS